jgi:ribose transport system permease protein
LSTTEQTPVTPPAVAAQAEELEGTHRFDGVAFLGNYALVGVLLALIALFTILAGSQFFSGGNFANILGSQADLVILALAGLIPLVTDAFDVSIGAMLSFAAVFVWWLNTSQHIATAPAIIITLAACSAIGGINAFLIVKLKINSFIATLGMATLITGLTLELSDQAVVIGTPQFLQTIAASHFWGIQTIVLFAAALALIMWFVLEFTPLGRWTVTTGSSDEVARLVGLPVTRIKVGALVLSAFVCGIGGLLYAGQFASADPNSGPGQLLPAFAAVFLGSTAIKRGRFNVWGTVLAVYVVIVGIVGLQITTGASGWVVDVFNGGILVVALATSNIIGSRPALH